MTWTVEPFSHVGPLTFGLSQSDVARLLGSPTRQNHSSPDDIRDVYEKPKTPCDMIVEYGVSGFESATFPWQDSDILICGEKFLKFSSTEALRKLTARNGGSFDKFIDQYYVFEQIGVVASDLEAARPSDKWLAVSSRSAFVRTIDSLKSL